MATKNTAAALARTVSPALSVGGQTRNPSGGGRARANGPESATAGRRANGFGTNRLDPGDVSPT